MTELFTIEKIGIYATILASVVTTAIFIWKKVLKPILNFINIHNSIVKSIETIKREVVTNGGSSLKDSVIALKQTCDRIEKSQKVIEQRSKSSLHYHNQALFETDKNGNLIWTNERFYEMTGFTFSDMEGLNWISYINEDDREDFIAEFSSCMKMCRKLEFKTSFINDKKIKLIAYPYKISESEHYGFLFHVSLIKE